MTTTGDAKSDEKLVERGRALTANSWDLTNEETALVNSLADRLEALSAQAPAGDGWRDIESAPTDGRSVLVFCPRASDHGYERIRLTWRKDGKWQGANNASWPPTHWMPLPPAPGEGQ